MFSSYRRMKCLDLKAGVENISMKKELQSVCFQKKEIIALFMTKDMSEFLTLDGSQED